MAVSPDPSTTGDLRQNLASTLSETQLGALVMREGKYDRQVLAEIGEGEYDMALVGADLPVSEQPQPGTSAAHLARICPVPLGIVQSCPSDWDRGLVCVRKPDPELPVVRTGKALLQALGMQPDVLHVAPATSKREELHSQSAAGEIRIRYGSVIAGIEEERGDCALVVVGSHKILAQPSVSEPTLVLPDLTRRIIQLGYPVTLVIGGPTVPLGVRETQPHPTKRQELARTIRFAAIEVAIYAALVVAYAAIAFRFLVDPLTELFHNNLTSYAVLALLLIVGQGTLLEALTSFLLDRLRLERFE